MQTGIVATEIVYFGLLDWFNEILRDELYLVVYAG
jgi:hypothetical protein